MGKSYRDYLDERITDYSSLSEDTREFLEKLRELCDAAVKESVYSLEHASNIDEDEIGMYKLINELLTSFERLSKKYASEIKGIKENQEKLDRKLDRILNKLDTYNCKKER